MKFFVLFLNNAIFDYLLSFSLLNLIFCENLKYFKMSIFDFILDFWVLSLWWYLKLLKKRKMEIRWKNGKSTFENIVDFWTFGFMENSIKWKSDILKN